MARPTVSEIVSGEQAWDVDLSDDMRALAKVSFPVPNGTFELHSGATEGSAYTLFSELPSASANEGCIAAVNPTGASNWELYWSNGATWLRIGTQAVDPGNSTATTITELVADFNELLVNLRATGQIA